VSPLKYLSAVFLLQSLLFPLSVYSLSFRLSYTALWGLLVSGSAYRRIFHRYLPMKLSAVLGAGLGAQLTTLPLITASFGIWYPAGIAAAPVLTVLSSVLMALGSLRLLFPLFSSTGSVLSGLMDRLVNLINGTAGLSAMIPGFEISEYLSWLIAVSGTILPLILIRSIRRGHQSFNQPRFPILHKGLSGEPGTGPPETLGAEFSYQSRSPEKNHLIP
jgi:competence protein ComEC